MVRALINRRPREGPWGGGSHFVRAFYEHAVENNVEIVEHLSMSPNVILVFHPDSEDGGLSFHDAFEYVRQNPTTKMVVRVNECDARKATAGVDWTWSRMIYRADLVVYVSEWMKRYFEDRLQLPPARSMVLENGVNPGSFDEKEDQKISARNGKINIVCAHWSDNAMKGQDTYEFLDDFVRRNPEFTFTFIGRTKANLQNSRLIPPMHPNELMAELQKYDVCVNGSRWDPGPNAVIESISAGLPTYVHADGGGGVDFAGIEHTFANDKELEAILLSKNFSMNRKQFEPWKLVMKNLFDEIKNL